MADVIEVIHKINYEVNDAALQNVTNVVRAQINEINKLTVALNSFQRQLNNTRNINALDELSRKIDNIAGQIKIKVGETKSVIEQFGSGLVKGMGLETDIEGITAKFFKPLAEHLIATKKEGKEAGLSLAAIGKELFSFSNVAPAAISLALNLATELYKFATATTKAEEAFKKFMSSLKENAKNTLQSRDSKISQVNFYRDMYKNASSEQRPAIIAHLQSLYPETFKNVDTGNLAKGDFTTIVKSLSAQIQKTSATEGFERGYELLDVEKKRLIEEVENAKIKLQKAKDDLADNPVVDKRFNREYSFKKAVEDADRDLKSLQRELNNTIFIQKKVAQVAAGFQPVMTSNSNSNSSPVAYTTQKSAAPVYLPKQPIDSIPTIWRDNNTPLPAPSSIKPMPVQVPSYTPPRIPSRLEQFMFGDTAEEQDPEKRRREEIEKSVSAYTSLVNTAVQAYQTITEAQIKALDKEIEIRRKRVDAATKLAERGNTEALRIEEERLAAAEKKRDEYAKRQAIINSALAVSNAIVAVAEAAAQSGVGAIVTVPAVIAAIVAGYAAISAATKESGSFKDGVVDFQGKGSGTSDSNVVRISHGESVITAAGTQRNREVLEAINRGTVFNMLQPNIKPIYMPAATQGMGGYASRGELKGLEKKMDTLIDTVAANGTTVHARMDERGMSLMTVKQIRREHNRFK